jgi:hypothetical protein
MFSGRASAFWTVAVVTVLILPAYCQLVISTRSGIVHFFQGAVYLNDQPLESHPGKFSSVPKGGVLHTGEGRAEVLLTPGVFVRIGQQSTIRMVDNELSHTRVALVAGSAVVDSGESDSGSSVTLICRNWNIRLLDPGIYRIDSDPPRLWVLEGKAEVSAEDHERIVLVGPGMDMPFAQVLVPQRSIDPPSDALSSWSEGRRQSISADNTIAANIQDPASMDPGTASPDSFTYFPLLGLPPIGPDLSSSYMSLGLYQPGFRSIYLPGYTFLPVLGFGTYGISAVRSPTVSHPIPVHPIYPYPIPGHPVYPFPTPIRPVYPHHPTPVSPVHPPPTTVHAGPPVGTHIGPHR